MALKKIFSINFLSFILIVFVASFFRLSNLDYIEFKTDEAVNLFLASRPLFGEPFPPGGTVSSIGLLNPPLFNYLLFPLVLISLDPRVITFLIALLNSLAIGFYFLILKYYYGGKIALTGSLFLCVSAWMILFSRKIWNQDFLFLFSLPLFFSLHKIILEKREKYWFIFGAFSIFLIQLHQTLIVFLLPLTVWVFFKYRPQRLRFLLLGTLMGFLPLLAYLFYILNNLITGNTGAFLVSKQYFSPAFSPALFLRPFQIIGQGNFQFVLGSDMITLAKEFPIVYKLRPLFYLEYLFLLLGFFLFWKNYPSLRNLLYFSLLLPLLYFFFHIEPFMHYFIILTPFLFLCLGLAFSHFFNLKNKFFKYSSFIVFFLLLVLSVFFENSIQEILTKQKGFRGDYGTSFMGLKEINERKLGIKEEKTKFYQERLIMSFIPENMLCDTSLPVARMIYSSKTQKNFCH